MRGGEWFARRPQLQPYLAAPVAQPGGGDSRSAYECARCVAIDTVLAHLPVGWCWADNPLGVRSLEGDVDASRGTAIEYDTERTCSRYWPGGHHFARCRRSSHEP